MMDFDYTSRARQFVFKYPLLNQILIQVSFWSWAFIFLVTIIHIVTNSIIEAYQLDAISKLGPALISALIIGMLYGFLIGLSDILYEKDYFKKISIAGLISFKILSSLLILIFMILFMRLVWIEKVMMMYFDLGENSIINNIDPRSNFYILLIYTSVMSAVISFIKQMNKKFGPGVLLPMMFGKYRNPRVEYRLFMFMDLKSSTMHAENLGHIKYSAMIRDCFFDINQVLAEYNADVYQYVGDEVVLTWLVNEDDICSKSIAFYFAVQKRFEENNNHYLENYNLLPEFKAGLHLGPITAVEIGEVKRDIAYHGDTLNTAARIQGICNSFNKNFLLSNVVKKSISLNHDLRIESLGDIQLKGKNQSIEVFSVDRKKA